jgi:O-antigen ligase
LVAGAACVLFASAVVVSFSRGGFVALAVTGLYCVWTGRHRVRNLLLGVLGALVFFLVIPSDYKTELGTISDTESGTADVRQFMWAAATNMWQDNPLLGVGAGNSSWRIGDYQPRDDPRFDKPQYTERNWTTQQVHSMYFQLLSELGIVGITVLGSIVVGQLLLLRNLRRRIARLRDLSPRAKDGIELYAVALAGGMVAFLSAGAFLSVLYYPYPYYFSAMAVAFSRAAVDRAPALAES